MVIHLQATSAFPPLQGAHQELTCAKLGAHALTQVLSERIGTGVATSPVACVARSGWSLGPESLYTRARARTHTHTHSIAARPRSSSQSITALSSASAVSISSGEDTLACVQAGGTCGYFPPPEKAARNDPISSSSDGPTPPFH